MKAIICAGTHGRAVVYGEIEGDVLPRPGDSVEIKDARMILYWGGTSGLFGLASKGPEEGSRITTPVASVSCSVCEALKVSALATEVLDGWPEE